MYEEQLLDLKQGWENVGEVLINITGFGLQSHQVLQPVTLWVSELIWPEHNYVPV